MHSANKKAFFGDYVFEVCENVYEPAEDSFLFAENLLVKAGASVLDMGTGSGILGILAAKQASEVIAMDVNPYAIRCAKQNAKRNNCQRNMNFLQGSLFTPLTEEAKFDLILFNSPYLPSEQGEDATWLGRAWAGGTTGRQVIDRFISQALQHLEGKGEILLMQSNLANVEQTQEQFLAYGLKTETVASLNLPFFETLVLLKATFLP
jgi:release factor glutamine methyltransferase